MILACAFCIAMIAFVEFQWERKQNVKRLNVYETTEMVMRTEKKECSIFLTGYCAALQHAAILFGLMALIQTALTFKKW